MAISYTASTWDTTNRTTIDSTHHAKDVAVTASAGDLLVAFGAASDQNGSTGDNGSVATQSGSTSAWTQAGTPDPVNSADCAFTVAYATVSTGGSITVRVTLACNSAAHLGAGVWVVPAAEWTGTPAFVAWGPGTGNDYVSVTLSNTSTVLLAGADWSAATASGSDPDGATEHTTHNGGTTYSVIARSWTGQTSGTDTYGLDSTAGTDWTGSAIVVQEASAGGASITATAVSGTSTVQNYTTSNVDIVIGGTSRQGIWT